MPATLIVPPETSQRLAAYAADLITGHATPGAYLAAHLASTRRSALT